VTVTDDAAARANRGVWRIADVSFVLRKTSA